MEEPQKFQEIVSLERVKTFSTTSSTNANSNHAESDSASSNGDTGIPPEIEKSMNRVFAHMALAFPHKWASAFPSQKARDLGKKVWAKHLKDLTLDDLERGCNNWNGDWPPSVTEFRRACKPPRELYDRPEFQRGAIPQKQADHETSLKWVDQLEKIVGGVA